MSTNYKVTKDKDIRQLNGNYIENELSNQPTSYNHLKSESQAMNEDLINLQPNKGLDGKANNFDDQDTNSNLAFDEPGQQSIKLSDIREISSNNDQPKHDFEPDESILSEINSASDANEESVESQIYHDLSIEKSDSNI